MANEFIDATFKMGEFDDDQISIFMFDHKKGI